MPRPASPPERGEAAVVRERGVCGWLEMETVRAHTITVRAEAPVPAPSPSVAALAIAPAGTAPLNLLLSSMVTCCLGVLP
jgi:hypothetical protein